MKLRWLFCQVILQLLQRICEKQTFEASNDEKSKVSITYWKNDKKVKSLLFLLQARKYLLPHWILQTDGFFKHPRDTVTNHVDYTQTCYFIIDPF